jgi:integrase
MCDTFDQLQRWQRFLEVSGKANAKTRSQYKRYVLRFLADVCKPADEVTEDDVIEMLATYAPVYRKQTIQALRSFYAWAEERYEMRNPVKRLHTPPSKLGPAPTLTDDELRRLLDAADLVDPRARWTIQLAYATGARVGSLVNVTKEDCREGHIVFRVAKHDKPYRVPLGPKGQEAVDELLGLRGYIPPTVKRRRPTLVGVGEGTVHRWVKLAGEIAGFRAYPHLLRHAFADRVANDPNTDMRTWTELMNHRDGSLMRRYAPPNDERMRNVVAAL